MQLPIVRLAFVTAVALSAASLAHAQDTTRVATPTLLKRLAEAVDGGLNGRLTYVVAALDSLNPVAGTFPMEAAAAALAARLGSRWQVFGPIRQDLPDWICRPGIRTPGLPCFEEPPQVGCHHDRDMSVMGGATTICPELARDRLVRPSEIDSITVVVHLRDGTRRITPYPRTTDAIFLSVQALDKFAFPYYARIIGLEAAAALRQRTIADLLGR